MARRTSRRTSAPGIMSQPVPRKRFTDLPLTIRLTRSQIFRSLFPVLPKTMIPVLCQHDISFSDSEFAQNHVEL